MLLGEVGEFESELVIASEFGGVVVFIQIVVEAVLGKCCDFSTAADGQIVSAVDGIDLNKAKNSNIAN